MHPFVLDDLLPPAEQIASLKERVARLEEFAEAQKKWEAGAFRLWTSMSDLMDGLEDLQQLRNKALGR